MANYYNVAGNRRRRVYDSDLETVADESVESGSDTTNRLESEEVQELRLRVEQMERAFNFARRQLNAIKVLLEPESPLSPEI